MEVFLPLSVIMKDCLLLSVNYFLIPGYFSVEF
jgi:hypothetical protein